MATLSMAQIKTLVNSAYSQMTGTTDASSALNLVDFTDTGSASLTGKTEQWLKALVGVITKNWFTDASYRTQYKDVFYEDSEQFGAIIQAISIDSPEVRDNSAWQSFTSGVSTVGQYTIYLPVVDTKYYTKSSAWAIPITFSGEQLKPAFHNESEISELVSYIHVVVDNALIQHMKDMNALNRNNFIAEKYKFQTDNPTTGVHVIDLNEVYQALVGNTTDAVSREEFLSDKNSMLGAMETIKEYLGYLSEQTSLFNTASKVKFVPKERLVVQMLSKFVNRYDTVAQSSTYHNELTKMPLYDEVACWQSMCDLSFDGLSKINVKTSDNHDITIDGVVALACDKYAIVHTIRSERVGVQHFDIEDLTHLEYQHRDQYFNNLSLNGIVFVINDYTPSP